MQKDEANEGEKVDSTVEDIRFPSGRWLGVWWNGKRGSLCSMWLEAAFTEGAIAGTGFDLIGDFVISGSYVLGGDCSFVKTYHFGHAVRYIGRHMRDGDRAGISGNWFVEETWGGFWLEPQRRPTSPANVPSRT